MGALWFDWSDQMIVTLVLPRHGQLIGVFVLPVLYGMILAERAKSFTP